MSVPTDQEMLDAIREAKHTVIASITSGKGVKTIMVNNTRVDAHDPKGLLEMLDAQERIYMERTEGDERGAWVATAQRVS